MSINPFSSIGAIRDIDMFYGRISELRRIFNWLCFDPPQSFQIIGDGKTGKTSLLNYLNDPQVRSENNLNSNHQIFINYSFQSNPLIEERAFWKRIFKKISRQLTDPGVKQTVVQYADLETVNSETVTDFFQMLMVNGYTTFLFVDEFQIVQHNPELFKKAFFENLRYINQHYNLIYILATEEHVSTLIPEVYGSPFPNTFGTIYLNSFTVAEARDFIMQAKHPIQPSLEEEQHFIYRQSGRHPYLMQIVSYAVFDLKSQKGYLEADDFQFVIEDCMDQAWSFFSGTLWPKLSDRMKKVLLYVAWGRPVDEFAYRDVIRPLSRYKNYITKIGSEYSIASDLFLRFLREQKSGGQTNAPPITHPIKSRPVMEYDDFQIDIGNYYEGQGYPIHVIFSKAGDGRDYSNFDVEMIQDDLESIRDRNTDLHYLKDFGSKLLTNLLVTKVKSHFDTAIGRTIDGNRGLRVRLRIEPPELAALPWEFIYDDDRGHWLATSSSITLSRYIETPLPQPEMDVKLPLNILLVLSNPNDIETYKLPRLNTDSERDGILRVMKDLIDTGLVTVDTIDHSSVSAIRRKLQSASKQYHILHFCGHGLFTDDEMAFEYAIPLDKNLGYLLFEDQNGQTRPAHQDTLGELFRDEGLQLVVINACRTAAAAPTERLSGLANTLVRAGLPAVVAMQYDMLDEIAQLFAVEFYKSLATGQPVDACVADARRAIAIDYDHANRDWATPVLFMRSEDGLIFKFKKS